MSYYETGYGERSIISFLQNFFLTVTGLVTSYQEAVLRDATKFILYCVLRFLKYEVVNFYMECELSCTYHLSCNAMKSLNTFAQSCFSWLSSSTLSVQDYCSYVSVANYVPEVRSCGRIQNVFV